MAEPITAYLRLETGLRQTCLGCSHILWEQGMLNKVAETDARISNAAPGAFTVVVYEIAPNFTLEECRAAVVARHVGDEWGH